MPEHRYVDESGFAGHTVSNAAGVRARVLANGALESLSVGPIMVNLLVGSPVGGGATKLYGRTHDAQGRVAVWKDLLSGARVETKDDALVWRGVFAQHPYAVALALHPEHTAWRWTVTWDGPGDFDAVLVQDVGVASRGQSQNNEAYTSQYIDHRVLDHPEHGPVVMARQNLVQPGGHPWVMHACVGGAAGVATDGLRFFGPSHRTSAVPELIASTDWPHAVLQHEWSMHALCSAVRRDEGPIVFTGVFVADHPEASAAADLARLDSARDWPAIARVAPPQDHDPEGGEASAEEVLFEAATASGDDLAAWCPGPHRHVEMQGGEIASFFSNVNRHGVTRAKEMCVTRRHGHLLRTGGTPVPSADAADAPLCSTVWAHGVFASHVCLGNTSFNKLLSVARDSYGIVNDSGLRLAVQIDGDSEWQRLAVPSLFEMGIDDVRWVYKHDRGTFEVVSRASGGRIQFAVFVTDGPAVAVKMTAHLVCGDREHEKPGSFSSNQNAGRFTFRPAADTLFAGAYPDAGFDLTFDEPDQLVSLGQLDNLPWATATTTATTQLRFSIGGALTRDTRDADPVSHVPAPLRLETDGPAAALADALPWFEHCAGIHLSAPHGLEQYGGAAWGVRDVCQGPLEWLLGRGDYAAARAILCDVFASQRDHAGGCPQWYMHPPFAQIASDHAHGDVPFWPILAAAQYLEASNDFAWLDEPLPYFDAQTHAPTHDTATVREHLERALSAVAQACLPDTALPAYGHGDWNDSLQPADPSLTHRMASGWTAGLYHMALRRLAGALTHHGEAERAAQLSAQADRVRDDFKTYVMKDGVAAGFYVSSLLQGDGPDHLLHPSDATTGVTYRLLPMIRGVLSELFTPDEAASHLALIKQHLLAPDGARLMDRPPVYRGGPMTHFQRSESASFFGREVGIMYVHAHLRYAQTLAMLGDAEGFYRALLTVCPVALADTVPNANPRQANLYFSSSDAAVTDRYDAAERYDALMRGEVNVDGGWRLYSSGPGIYVGLVSQHLLGLRPRFDQLIVDPQLPAALLDGGFNATLTLEGRPAQVRFEPADAATLTVNGTALTATGTEANPYRRGGSTYARADVVAALRDGANDVVIGVADTARGPADRLTL